MPGAPADKSLLSKMVHGSKCFSPKRWRLRCTGSKVMCSPVGSSITVVSLTSGLTEPMRTFSPPMLKMRCSCATLLR